MYSTDKVKKLSLLMLASLGLSACMASSSPPPEPVATPPEPVIEPEPEPAAPPRPQASPDRLNNATPRDVVALMGEPSLMRRDGKVQVMLFENHDCVLEVVFMEPGPDAHFQATHITARTRDGDDTDTQACLVQLLPGGMWPDDR